MENENLVGKKKIRHFILLVPIVVLALAVLGSLLYDVNFGVEGALPALLTELALCVGLVLAARRRGSLPALSRGGRIPNSNRNL